MANGVGDGSSTASRIAKQCGLAKLQRVHYRRDVTHPRVEGKIANAAIGEAGAAPIVANVKVMVTHEFQVLQGTRIFGAALQVTVPSNDFDHRQSRCLAHRGVGDSDPVGGPAEPYILADLQSRRLGRRRGQSGEGRRPVSRVDDDADYCGEN